MRIRPASLNQFCSLVLLFRALYTIVVPALLFFLLNHRQLETALSLLTIATMLSVGVLAAGVAAVRFTAVSHKTREETGFAHVGASKDKALVDLPGF